MKLIPKYRHNYGTTCKIVSTMRFTLQLFNYKQWVIQTNKQTKKEINKQCETFWRLYFNIVFFFKV